MARLVLTLFGPFRVTLNEQPVTSFPYKKVQALFTYLAVEANRPQHRDALAALLWSEQSNNNARGNLRKALSSLRDVLGERTPEIPFFLVTHNTIQFNRASDQTVDVSTFVTLLDTTAMHQHPEGELCPDCIVKLEQAVALYHAEFLAQFSLPDCPMFEEWAALTREQLHRKSADACGTLAAYYENQHNWEQAQKYVQRQLELEPWNEAAHRCLMRVFAFSGQRGAALHQYRRCRQVLFEELGVEPEIQITALYEQICAGTFPPSIEFSDTNAEGQNPQPGWLGIVHDWVRARQISSNQRQDWGEAVDVSVFYGRTEELAVLEQWIVKENCRLVALLGMGGIGKTTLAIRGAKQIQDEFEYIIWRSLRNAPPIKDILANLIQFLSNQQEIDLPKDIDDRVSRLITYLRSSRCLIILDNVEMILLSSSCAGHYREGYEAYGELLRRVCEESHQSCLLLTSREEPKELRLLEGETLPVRSLRLTGLKTAEGREIFSRKGSFSGSESEWGLLIKHYAGNPLALKMVAAAIQDLLDSSVSKFLEFLQQGTLIFDDIRALLDRQFNRLSDLEREIMYWLAIEREPIALAQLQENILSLTSRRKLPEALRSLGRRSLIEKGSTGFTQQPVIMEYITDLLIEQIYEEITTENFSLMLSHAVIKAQAKDYIRATQIRIILEPIAERLRNSFGPKENIEYKLNRVLVKFREEFSASVGYGAGNIINLLCHFKINLAKYDFSDLNIWQAYLQDVDLHHVNFARSDLSRSVFAETLGGIFSVTFSPDGKLVATSDSDGDIRLWQIANGQQLFTFKAHSLTFSIAFSPDGHTLASTSLDQMLRLWDVRTGQCLKTLQGHTNSVWSVNFSPDGHTLASGSSDYTVKLWDVRTGQCLKTLQEHTNQVWAVAFNPNGQILASGSEDQTVRLWDVTTGQCLKTLHQHTSRVSSVAFSPNSHTLASGCLDETVRLWDVNSGQCLKTLQEHTNQVLSVAFSSDGHTLASSSASQIVRLWDISSGQCLKTLQGHSNRVWSIAFSPDGQTLASGGDDHSAKLWDVSSGQCLRTLRGHTNSIFSIAFSPDGQTLASGSANRTVKLWDLKTGQCLNTLQGHASWVFSVAGNGSDVLIRLQNCAAIR